MAKVSVVILNWNGKSLLEKFLHSVIENSKNPNYEVIVADNGSNDGSVEYLKSHFPQIKLILFDKNYGFTGGYNKALKNIDSEYFILLNSDVEIKSSWIEPMVDLADSDKTIAAIMPKILSQQEPQMFEYAGACGGFIDKYGFPFCRGRIMQNREQDMGQYDSITEIFWASGAAMFVRADLYKKYGGLDDSFFAHMEEIDLCWRLKNLGYKIAVQPQSTVYHLGGGTLSNDSPKKLYLNFRNNLFMLHKNLPQKGMKSLIFKRMLIDGAIGCVYLLKLKPKCFMAIVKAHNHYRDAIPELNEKREDLLKTIKDNQNISNKKGILNGSLLYNYAIGKRFFSDYKSISIE